MKKIVYSLAAAGLAAGCTAGPAAAAPAHRPGATSSPALGTVTGRSQLEGGPSAAPPSRPLPGTVEFELSGRTHRVVSVTTGPSGTFSARLPPGTYHVNVRSPHIREQQSDGRLREQPCAQPTTVTVIARRTATITLTCIVP